MGTLSAMSPSSLQTPWVRKWVLWVLLSEMGTSPISWSLQVKPSSWGGFAFTRPGKHTKNDGKSPCLMGKSTISMAMFNSELFNYQRVLFVFWYILQMEIVFERLWVKIPMLPQTLFFRNMGSNGFFSESWAATLPILFSHILSHSDRDHRNDRCRFIQWESTPMQARWFCQTLKTELQLKTRPVSTWSIETGDICQES